MTTLTQKYWGRLALLARIEAAQCRVEMRRELRAICDGDRDWGERLAAQARLIWHLRDAAQIGLCREEELQEAIGQGFCRTADLAASILSRAWEESHA